jgi:hypothetical protein
MSDPHKTPGMTFFATIFFLSALVLYCLSIGPAVWLENHGYIPGWAVYASDLFYDPFWIVVDHLPERLQGWVNGYLYLWNDGPTMPY